MENNAYVDTKGVGIRALLRQIFGSEADRPQKDDDEVAEAFKKVSKRIEVKEKSIRVGETMAKVRGKNSVKGMPTFSKESLNIQKAQMKKGKRLEKSNDEQAIINADSEIAE